MFNSSKKLSFLDLFSRFFYRHFLLLIFDTLCCLFPPFFPAPLCLLLVTLFVAVFRPCFGWIFFQSPFFHVRLTLLCRFFGRFFWLLVVILTSFFLFFSLYYRFFLSPLYFLFCHLFLFTLFFVALFCWFFLTFCRFLCYIFSFFDARFATRRENFLVILQITLWLKNTALLCWRHICGNL